MKVRKKIDSRDHWTLFTKRIVLNLPHSILIELLARNSLLLLCLQHCLQCYVSVWLLLERENYRFMISCMCYTVGVYFAWHWSPMAIIAPAITTVTWKYPRQVKKIENASKQWLYVCTFLRYSQESIED